MRCPSISSWTWQGRVWSQRCRTFVRTFPSCWRSKKGEILANTEDKEENKMLSCLARGATHLRMMTLPSAVAFIWPSSPIKKLATMLSSKNRPSGSFFATAYHVPAYWEEMNPPKRRSEYTTQDRRTECGAALRMLPTHPGLVKVLHDLDVGHLAVLSPGHPQEAEGHRVPQHFTSEERQRPMPWEGSGRTVRGKEAPERKGETSQNLALWQNRSFQHQEHIPGSQGTDSWQILWCADRSCSYIHAAVV